MRENPQAYERHAEANFKLHLGHSSTASWAIWDVQKIRGKANQRTNLAARPAVMQRPQYGAVLSQLRCSCAKREPMGLPTASLHRSLEPKQFFC